MQLPNLLTEKVSEWRTAGYPHDDFPAIAEILEWLAVASHGELRFLRTPQVRVLETFWYMRLSGMKVPTRPRLPSRWLPRKLIERFFWGSSQLGRVVLGRDAPFWRI